MMVSNNFGERFVYHGRPRKVKAKAPSKEHPGLAPRPLRGGRGLVRPQRDPHPCRHFAGRLAPRPGGCKFLRLTAPSLKSFNTAAQRRLEMQPTQRVVSRTWCGAAFALDLDLLLCKMKIRPAL